MGMVFCRGCGKEMHESAATCPHCGAPQKAITGAATKLKSQTIAACLAAFLGGFGIHRFYLGPIWLGVLYLIFSWTGIPGIVAYIETFVIAFTSQQAWANKYNNGVITDPAHISVKIIVLVIPAIIIAGVIAAIAIPAYQEYKKKEQEVLSENVTPSSTTQSAVVQASVPPPALSPPSNIVGVWKGNLEGEGAMEIKPFRNGYGVQISVVTETGCAGSIDSYAVLSGNSLTLSDDSGEAICEVVVQFTGDTAKVSEGNNCMPLHGAACGFSGTLRKVE